MIKDVKGKRLTHEHYRLLKDLGIEVVIYDLKTHDKDDRVLYSFEIQGAIKDHVDFDELLLMLKLLKQAQSTEDSSIQEMYKQLITMLYLTEK